MIMILLYGWQAAEKDQVKDRVKAETVKALLAVVDSFEMAKGSLKPESEGEKKIDGAYQVSLCTNAGSSALCVGGCGICRFCCLMLTVHHGAWDT